MLGISSTLSSQAFFWYNIIMFRRISKFFLILALVVSTWANGGTVLASINENTRGWAWSDNTGWFSHNSIDDPTVPTFGVHIDQLTGVVSGYAYSETLGWIQFDPSGPYPVEGPNNSVIYDVNTGELSGWAQIVGWGASGWIKMRDAGPCGGCPYGVTVSTTTGVFSGFAWNDIAGWFDFAPAFGGLNQNSGQNPSVSGWAWNEGYGWISMRYDQYDADFGVNLEANATFTGYAWSENLGWVQYNPAGPYPAAPNYSARWNSVGEEVSGWVKVVAMGASGWIKMRKDPADSGSNYGVTLSKTTGVWSGYAWNDTIGWIQFTHPYTSNAVTTTFNASGPGAPILLTPVSVSGPPNCVDTYTIKPSAPLEPNLDWSDYAALDGSTQKSFQIQVSTDSGFASTVIDYTAPPVNTASIFAVNSGILAFNNTYYWRVRVQSTLNTWSDWGAAGGSGELNCFKTPKHLPPVANFSLNPSTPLLNIATKFTDSSTTSGGATISNWSWTFGDGQTLSGGDPTVHKNPNHTYAAVAPVSITLTVTDSDGYIGSKTINVTVSQQLPGFERIIPR